MEENNKIQLFEDKRIRTAWDEEREEWYFSIIDVVGVLTDSKEPRRYWSDLKAKLKDEGNQLYDKIVQLKMTAKDGKKRLTDVANTEELLRIIQSIPSPKAEPFKMWLARVGSERIEETIDPELTDEWDNRGVKQGLEYAILTDEIYRAWSGMSTRQYKDYKGLIKENLRDNMSTLELVLNMLAEATTTEISKTTEPESFEENKNVAKRGGQIAGNARKEIEKDTGKPVITNKNALDFSGVISGVIEEVNSDDDK